MLEPNLGIEESCRKTMIEELTKLLADQFVVFVQAYNFHWNVIGSDFVVLHGVFKEAYERQAEIVDTIAERIRALGSKTIGTMQEFLENTRFKETPGKDRTGAEMVGVMLSYVQSSIRSFREVNKSAENCLDVGSANMFQNFIEESEKFAWKLRSTIE